MEQSEETVDELFRLAREAVGRQVNEKTMEFPPKEEVVVPRVAANGNGGEYATDKQKNYLRKLNADKRRDVNIESLSKHEASTLIKELMEV